MAVDATATAAPTGTDVREPEAGVTGEPSTVAEAGSTKLVATGAAIAALIVALLMV